MIWTERIREMGFADFRLTEMPSYRFWRETVEKRGIWPHVHEPDEPYTSALVLLYPYRLYRDIPEGIPVLSAFYPASNTAYHGARKLSAELCGSGIAAKHATETPYKPAAQKSGLSRYGINCLQHHPVYGSLCALEVVCFYDEPLSVSEKLGIPLQKMDEPSSARDELMPMCAGCMNCREHCPMGALGAEGITITRCLRFHMLKAVEEEEIRRKMGLRLLGCDECNRSCLQNMDIPDTPYPEAVSRLFTFENMLDEKRLRSLLPEIGEVIGTNYARAVPLLRQVSLIAGNSRDRSLLPLLEKLVSHEDAGIAAHAAWSCRELKNNL